MNKDYFEQDISPLLRLRGKRQLEQLFAHIDAQYPDGIFTLLDVGCADGNLLEVMATRYPSALLLGLDIDLNSEYEAAWANRLARNDNILSFFKGNMADGHAIINQLPRQFGGAVDYVHSHAASMYLNSEKTRSWLRSLSSYARYVFTRDTHITQTFLACDRHSEPCARIIEQLYRDIDSHWTQKFGRHVGPMTGRDVRGSGFDFRQFCDWEHYESDAGEVTLQDYITAIADTVPTLVEDSQTEQYIADASDAYREFSAKGSSYTRLWLVSVLENHSS